MQISVQQTASMATVNNGLPHNLSIRSSNNLGDVLFEACTIACYLANLSCDVLLITFGGKPEPLVVRSARNQRLTILVELFRRQRHRFKNLDATVYRTKAFGLSIQSIPF